jgi:hypothetical protein
MTQPATNPLQDKIARIETKLDTEIAADLSTSSGSGGMVFRNMVEVMEFAKLVAVSDVAVPKHLRGNVGASLAVVVQAIEWRMSPYAVANKSYVVNDRISYESQLIHAVVEQRAPLVGRLRCSFSGEGNNRKCKVWACVKGEDEPLEYESPAIGDIQPKNSPLWKTKPDLQLFYNASRDWARMYFPDVILGVYAEDEIDRQPAAQRSAGSVNGDVSSQGVAGLRGRMGIDQETDVMPKNDDAIDVPFVDDVPEIDVNEDPDVLHTDAQIMEPHTEPAGEPEAEAGDELTDLRNHVRGSLESLDKKDQKNLMAGRKLVKDMDRDELKSLEKAIEEFE